MSALARYLPIFGLLSGATVWGLIWYPYRVLEQAGISGVQSSLATYAVAMLIGISLFFGRWRQASKLSWEFHVIGFCAGWTNLSYVLAVLGGEVMRVLLLFYLAPLWTLLLARLLLGERAGTRGAVIMTLSLAGMLSMLWQGWELPLPRDRYEWLALSSGMAFAATNVMTRRAVLLSLPAKSMSVWVGVVLISALLLPFDPNAADFRSIQTIHWGLMAAMGLVLAATTWLVQYGISHTPANRTAVIFMFELVVAALSSYWLAGEAMQSREWVGGGMIVLAALYASRPERKDAPVD